MKKIILGLVIVLGLSFCATGIVGATEIESSVFQYQETTTSPINTWVGSLSYGMRSEAVRELQQTLSGDNYTHIYPEKLTTGYFGSLTLQAVKRFQASQGLQQTGIVNEYLKELIWEPISEFPEIPEPTYLEPVCDKVCMAKGYSNGTCRNACYAGEVNLGATSDCNYCPPGVACATVMSYCCCGQEQGDSGDCTDSDGGINKYVKGTTCQPSERFSGSTSSVASGDMASLFCKTDACLAAHSTGIYAPIEYSLIEYYCENGIMMSKNIRCENGCADGACLRVEIPPIPLQPYCDAIGSRSEGWYQHGELIGWENCDGCVAECKAIGSKSEGWYSSGSCETAGKLIKWDNCAPEEECTPKGERVNAPFNCCPGLVWRACPKGEVCPISVKYCLDCGNGVCEEHEDDFNCPEDCDTTTPPVDVQPVIDMIRQAIERLNQAIRLLGEISSVDGGWAH